MRMHALLAVVLALGCDSIPDDCNRAQQAKTWSMRFALSYSRTGDPASCPVLADRTVTLPFTGSCPAGCTCGDSSGFVLGGGGNDLDHHHFCGARTRSPAGDGSRLDCSLDTAGPDTAIGGCSWAATTTRSPSTARTATTARR